MMVSNERLRFPLGASVWRLLGSVAFVAGSECLTRPEEAEDDHGSTGAVSLSPSYRAEVLVLDPSNSAPILSNIPTSEPFAMSLAPQGDMTSVDLGRRHPNAGAIALLRSWRDEDAEDGEDTSADLEELMRDLDAHRLSDRKLFP